MLYRNSNCLYLIFSLVQLLHLQECLGVAWKRLLVEGSPKGAIDALTEKLPAKFRSLAGSLSLLGRAYFEAGLFPQVSLKHPFLDISSRC